MEGGLLCGPPETGLCSSWPQKLRYLVLESALAFEEKWGGMIWGGDEPVDQGLVSPYAVLTSDAESFTRPSAPPVPLTVVDGPGDTALYIDEQGRIWR